MKVDKDAPIREWREGERVVVTLKRTVQTTKRIDVHNGDVCYVVRIAGSKAILKIDPGCPDVRGIIKVPVADIRPWVKS